MRVVSLNQDAGIGPERKKGAAVHLLAMREAFREAGHAVHSLDSADDICARTELENALRGTDLLYERYALGRSLGSELCATRGVPHVVELNAPLADEDRAYRGGTGDPGLDAREAAIFSRATLVIAVSQQVAAYAIARGALRDNVLVRPNGVDARRFVPRKAGDSLRNQLVPPGRFVLGFHGRLRPWHGLSLLGEAAATLLSGNYPIHLVLVGEGNFKEALGERVAPEHITRVPWVPHIEMPRFVATFDALPLTYAPDGPSYFSPLKLAEAMACGVVPVFPLLGDLPQLLKDGTDSLGYTPGDAEGLTRTLAYLMDNPSVTQRLSHAAVARAGLQSWRAIADDVIDWVEGRLGPADTLLASPSPGRRPR
ncbi:MAG: glycosyltransferase involved in cell wall biosynthesis [Planctomycetota bacterium]|jgi:glycosyltransferase involved in cell wall biosynthesis